MEVVPGSPAGQAGITVGTGLDTSDAEWRARLHALYRDDRSPAVDLVEATRDPLRGWATYDVPTVTFRRLLTRDGLFALPETCLYAGGFRAGGGDRPRRPDGPGPRHGHGAGEPALRTGRDQGRR